MNSKSPTARELFVAEKTAEPPRDPPSAGNLDNASIASTILYGLDSIKLLMVLTRQDINSAKATSDTRQNLKECMTMLFELQKKEKDFLSNLSEEELKKLAE